jgi:hypothetical protein
MDFDAKVVEIAEKMGEMIGRTDAMNGRLDGLCNEIKTNHALIFSEIQSIKENCRNQCNISGGSKIEENAISAILNIWKLVPFWVKAIIVSGTTLGGVFGFMFSIGLVLSKISGH